MNAQRRRSPIAQLYALWFIGVLVFTQAGAAAPQSAELKPFVASYAWSWHGANVAVSTLRLERGDADTWTYSSSAEPRGLGYLYPLHPKLISVLRITDSGVQPQSFHAEGGGDDHNAQVEFDWQALRASGVYEGVKVDMPITAGVQDDLSVQIALMVELLHGRVPEHLTMLDKNELREYRYKREGDATIDTPFGPTATVIYSSQHPGSPRITRFWCAPAMGYLPMRVEQKRIDKVEWSMQIEKLQR